MNESRQQRESPAQWRRVGLGRLVEFTAIAFALYVWLDPLMRVNDIWIAHGAGFDPLRAMGVVDAWRAGLADARWFPSFDWGYGYPMLSFYAPLYHWGMALLLVAGIKVQTAAWVWPAMWLVFGTTGIYLAAQRIWNDLSDGAAARARPGLIAALGWLMSPYVILNVHVRADGAEFAADQCYPWVLWAGWSVLAGCGPLGRRALRRALFGGAVIGAAVLTHNFAGMCAVGFALMVMGMVWCAVWIGRWKWAGDKLIQRSAVWLTTVVWAVTATAFFWAPALLESRLLQMQQMFNGQYSYTNHFLYLVNLLQVETWGTGNSPAGSRDTIGLHLGRVSMLAAVSVTMGMGILARRWRDGASRRVMGGLAALTLFTGMGIWITTPASRFVWDRVALLQYGQFPWRLLILGTVGVCALLPAALVAVAGLESTGRFRVAAGAAAVLMLGCLILTYAFYLPPAKRAREFQVGLGGRMVPAEVALDRCNWKYVPGRATFPLRTVDLDEYRAVWSTFMAAPAILPGAVSAEAPVSARVLEDSGVQMRIAVKNESNSVQPVIVGYNYFPGWKAQSGSGEALRVGPARVTGYIRIADVPPGDSEIRLWFGNTPIRTVTKAISAMAWLVWVAAWLWAAQRRRRARMG